MVPTLDRPDFKVRDMAFSVSQGGRSFLLRNEDWAFIQYDEDGGAGMELFDMKKDPQQYTNLAEDPDYAETVDFFRKKLKKKLAEVRQNDLGLSYP